jgi:hypothetical protein
VDLTITLHSLLLVLEVLVVVVLETLLLSQYQVEQEQLDHHYRETLEGLAFQLNGHLVEVEGLAKLELMPHLV